MSLTCFGNGYLYFFTILVQFYCFIVEVILGFIYGFGCTTTTTTTTVVLIIANILCFISNFSYIKTAPLAISDNFHWRNFTLLASVPHSFTCVTNFDNSKNALDFLDSKNEITIVIAMAQSSC